MNIMDYNLNSDYLITVYHIKFTECTVFAFRFHNDSRLKASFSLLYNRNVIRVVNDTNDCASVWPVRNYQELNLRPHNKL